MQTGKFCYFSFDFFLCNFFFDFSCFRFCRSWLTVVTDAYWCCCCYWCRCFCYCCYSCCCCCNVVVADMSLFIIEREIFLSIKDRVFKTNYGKILSEFESQLTGSGTWTLGVASSPLSSRASSRWGSLEGISCIASECDRTSRVVTGQRLCAINRYTDRPTVDR